MPTKFEEFEVSVATRSEKTALPDVAVNPYSVEAFKIQVQIRQSQGMLLGPAIARAGWDAPGFRAYTSREMTTLVAAAYPGSGMRCCNCRRFAKDVKIRPNDAIACDDCSAGVR